MLDSLSNLIHSNKFQQSAQRGRSDPAGPAQAEAQPPLDMAPRGGARRRTPREAPTADVDIGVNS